MKAYDFGAVERATEERIRNGVLPGACMAICRNGERIFEFTAGYQDFDKKNPLSKDALFRLASMTKPITAVSVLLQEERGKLRVTDNVSDYLPEYKHMFVGELDSSGRLLNTRAAEREMTIEDILTHGSGLGAGLLGARQYETDGHREGRSLEENVHAFSKYLLDFSPGTSQLYSAQVALDVAARIVELTSGCDYETFLKENIFVPLNMSHTAYKLTEKQWKSVVPMYRLSDDAKSIARTEESKFGRKGFECFPEGYPGGAAGLFGTLDDYMNFADMLCSEGMFEGKRILSAETVRRMRTPHYPDGFAGMNGFFNWGYTVMVRSVQQTGMQELSPGSYGWSGAYNTHFWVDPVLHIAAVYMSNLDNAGGAGAATAFEFEKNTMDSLRLMGEI